MAFDIFICCDKRDHRRVLSIVQDLRNRGYDVCYDRDDSITGKNWEETISSTLQGVSIILLFLSSRSVNDPQVLWVANYARDYDIPIIDVQIEKIKQDEDIRSFPYAEDILDLRNYKTYGEFVVAIRPALKKAGVVHGEATAVKDMTPPHHYHRHLWLKLIGLLILIAAIAIVILMEFFPGIFQSIVDMIYQGIQFICQIL